MLARAWILIPILMLAIGSTARTDEADGPDPKGKPKDYKVGSGKYAIWYDDAGWHVRATAAKVGQKFTGKVESVEGKFTSFKLVSTTAKTPAPKKGAGGLPGFEGKELDVKFTLLKGSESGFDFKLDDATKGIKFTLMVDEKEAPELILIGSQGAHPKEATFELLPKPAKK